MPACTHGRYLLGRQLASARRRYRSTGERLLILRELTRSTGATASLVNELAEEKASLADLLRTEQALTASLVAAGEWQSPSFVHSATPAAGRQNGQIKAHWNDYKRDRHLDGKAFEGRWTAAMVDGSADVRALLTTCGMAAVTTVLSFLQMEGKLDGPVLVRAGVYHETRLLLERVAPRQVHAVDEQHTLIEAAVAEAATRGVAVHGGARFGFNTSRIYLTAARAEYGDPFVRVAAGTEHTVEIERLAGALTAAVRRSLR